MMSALTGFGLARRQRAGLRSAVAAPPVPRRRHVHRWGGASSVVVGRLRRMCKAMACSVLP
jgi:hypothetical protein